MLCTLCGSDKHGEQNCPHRPEGERNKGQMRCISYDSNKHNIVACPDTFSGNAARAWRPKSIVEDLFKD